MRMETGLNTRIDVLPQNVQIYLLKYIYLKILENKSNSTLISCSPWQHNNFKYIAKIPIPPPHSLKTSMCVLQKYFIYL